MSADAVDEGILIEKFHQLHTPTVSVYDETGDRYQLASESQTHQGLQALDLCAFSEHCYVHIVLVGINVTVDVFIYIPTALP